MKEIFVAPSTGAKITMNIDEKQIFQRHIYILTSFDDDLDPKR